MNNIPGEDWKEASVTPQDVRRYITMKDKLLVQLPWFQTPVEMYMVNAVKQGDYIKVSGSLLGNQWVKREQVEVLAILPHTPKPQARTGMKNMTDQTPPWFQELEEGV